MKQFEYHVTDVNQTIEKLNELGLQGWEIIHADHSGFLFKRQLS